MRGTPFRILVSVLLSARTRDEVTEAACRALFAVADTPEAMARLDEEEIADRIRPVGFFRQKAAQIKALSALVAARGEVPRTFAELTTLPGIGRKSANLVLALAFDQPAIAVDIHVFRISRRLGWAGGETPAEVEKELKPLFPRSAWNLVNQTLVGFGQTICKAQKPRCTVCILTDRCRFYRENVASASPAPAGRRAGKRAAGS